MKINGHSISKEEMLNKFGLPTDHHIQVVSIGNSFEFYTVAKEEKDLIINLFDLGSEKEIEGVITKLKYVELVWTDDDFTLLNLIDSWNVVSNEKAVNMIQLLESFYKASTTSKSEGLAVEDLNTLTTYIASTTREQGLIIGNALKSIITRISTESVIDELANKDIKVSKEDNTMIVFNKIKNYLSNITNQEHKDTEISNISKIIGGNYHLARTSAIIHSL